MQSFKGLSVQKKEADKKVDIGPTGVKEDNSNGGESPTRKIYASNFFNSSQKVMQDQEQNSRSQSPKTRTRAQSPDNQIEPSEKNKSHSRVSTLKDQELKARDNLKKRSLFRTLVDEQEAKQTMMTMNDNRLSSLIFADPEKVDDQTAGRYDKMIEKLALKNIHLATLNNLLSTRKTFTKIIMQMTESHCIHMYETLKLLYIEIIELLKGAQQIRNIFEAAPMIATSMSIEEAMRAIVNYVCDSLKCERATVFALDEANRELWSKIATGRTKIIRQPGHY